MSYPTIRYERPRETTSGAIVFQKTDKQINKPQKLNDLINDIGNDVWFMSEKAHDGISTETLAEFLEKTAAAIAFVSATLEKQQGESAPTNALHWRVDSTDEQGAPITMAAFYTHGDAESYAERLKETGWDAKVKEIV